MNLLPLALWTVLFVGVTLFCLVRLVRTQRERSVPPYPFKPDYRVHPGETLLELMSGDLARDLKVADHQYLVSIVKGLEPVTPELALKFSAKWGMSVSFWLNMQKNYEEPK